MRKPFLRSNFSFAKRYFGVFYSVVFVTNFVALPINVQADEFAADAPPATSSGAQVVNEQNGNNADTEESEQDLQHLKKMRVRFKTENLSAEQEEKLLRKAARILKHNKSDSLNRLLEEYNQGKNGEANPQKNKAQYDKLQEINSEI